MELDGVSEDFCRACIFAALSVRSNVSPNKPTSTTRPTAGKIFVPTASLGQNMAKAIHLRGRP